MSMKKTRNTIKVKSKLREKFQNHTYNERKEITTNSSTSMLFQIIQKNLSCRVKKRIQLVINTLPHARSLMLKVSIHPPNLVAKFNYHLE
jgi:hypothetical protein